MNLGGIVAYPVEQVRRFPAAVPLRSVQPTVHPEAMLARVPPHDRAAENAVLGSMLTHPAAARVAAEMLRPEHFYHGRVQILFEVLQQMYFAGMPIDEICVRSQLVRLGKLDEIGGADVLSVLIDETPNASNIEGYCRAVTEAAIQRDLIKAAGAILRGVYEPEGRDGRALLDLARVSVDQVRTIGALQSDACSVADLDAQFEAEISGARSDFGWPWPIMSSSGSMMPGSCMTICGPAGSGKSFFLFELIWRAFLNGWSASSMNLEKHSSFHLRRFLAQLTGKNGIMSDKWLRANLDEFRRLRAEYNNALNEIANHRIFQTPTLGQLPTVAYLLRWLREEMDRGVKILLLDPISNLHPSALGRLADEELLIAETNRLVGQFQSVVIFSTHPKTARSGFPMAPGTDNISGSQSFSRFVDSVFWLMPHANRTDLIVGEPDLSAAREYNRTIYWLKTKLTGDAAGTKRVAFKFNYGSLCYEEQGVLREENK